MKKTMFAMVLVATMLCTSAIPAVAQEASVDSEMQSCVECGATGYYKGVRYGEWFLYQKSECTHGHAFDVRYARHIYEDTRCSYCNYLLGQDFIRTEVSYRMCVDE